MTSNLLVRADELDGRILALKGPPERWKAETELADLCFEIEESAHDCLDAYKGLCRLDEQWHLESLKDPNATDGSFKDRLQELFQHWHDSTLQLIQCIHSMGTEYVDRGFDGKVVRQVVKAFRQCEALLNPSDAETELADQAIAQHRAGLTEDF